MITHLSIANLAASGSGVVETTRWAAYCQAALVTQAFHSGSSDNIHESFTVSWNSLPDGAKPATITVRNVNGTVAVSETISSPSGYGGPSTHQDSVLTTGSIPSGTYYATVSSGGCTSDSLPFYASTFTPAPADDGVYLVKGFRNGAGGLVVVSWATNNAHSDFLVEILKVVLGESLTLGETIYSARHSLNAYQDGVLFDVELPPDALWLAPSPPDSAYVARVRRIELTAGSVEGGSYYSNAGEFAQSEPLFLRSSSSPSLPYYVPQILGVSVASGDLGFVRLITIMTIGTDATTGFYFFELFESGNPEVIYQETVQCFSGSYGIGGLMGDGNHFYSRGVSSNQLLHYPTGWSNENWQSWARVTFTPSFPNGQAGAVTQQPVTSV